MIPTTTTNTTTIIATGTTITTIRVVLLPSPSPDVPFWLKSNDSPGNNTAQWLMEM